jgi:hypothetical protein
MKTLIRFFFFFVLAMAMVFGFTACPEPPDDSTPSGPKATLRYETVPAVSASFGRVVGVNDPYVSVTSAYDDNYYYYLFYLGYVKSTPILYKDAFLYEGRGTQTIAYEITESIEDTIMESMTRARDETIEHNWGVTVSVETTGKADFIFAAAEVELGLEASYGGSVSNTLSISNTTETSKTHTSGETQRWETTIDSNDPLGSYRYVLFATVDVYCAYTVNKTTRRPIASPKVTQCARKDTYRWGIDFEPLNSNGRFGKTGPGDTFKEPRIDFSTLAIPTTEIQGELKPEETPELQKSWFNTRTNTVRVKDNDYFYEPHTINPAFEIDKLQDEGYNTFHCTLEFQAKEIYDGYVEVYVIATHANTYGDVRFAPEWKRWWSCTDSSDDKIDLPSSGWHTIKKEFDVPFTAMVADQTFTIAWGASGGFADDYDLSTRTITIAVKE